MDLITINKLSTPKKVQNARNAVYNQKKINTDESLILIVYACKKLYGMNNTAKIIHGLGVDKF